MALRLSLAVCALLALGGCIFPRYKLDMAFEKDRDDAVPLQKAQDECRYDVEKQARRAHSTGASEIEVKLIGDLAESCMRSKGYKTTRKAVVREGS